MIGRHYAKPVGRHRPTGLAVSWPFLCVSSASAVSIGGQEVGFTAPSSGGKFTLAALACRAGAELVADDILAVAVDGSDVRCLPGSRELRLRPATAELLAGAPWPKRRTADARVAVLVGRHELAPPRLTAKVVPIIAEDREPAIERLRSAAATRALLGCARVVSLRTREQCQAMFRLAATLGGDIPVYRVRMPSLMGAALPQTVGTLLADHLGPPE